MVLDHAFGWPAGGFVGVDVFYVISGFLITGLLMRELQETGSVSLRGFYARRVRRIVPAAALVLTVTVGAAFALWFLPRALQTLLDALSALFFVSNWHFIAVGTDYLQGEGAVSPVQHYWSLSIEEQFYAMWPLMVLVLFYVLRRSRALLAIAVAVGIVGSLAIAAVQTSTDPLAGYFDTFGRAWELLVGALIAILGPASERAPESARRAISYVGLGAILSSAVIVQADWAVPFPWVAPAVVGAGALIWARAHAPSTSILGNPVSQWFGDVSYSLYLWHFPILVFAWSVFGSSWIVGLGCIPVMLVLAELSRRYVERRVMGSRLLRHASKTRNPRPFVAKDVAVGVVALAAIVVLSVGQLRGPSALWSAARPC